MPKNLGLYNDDLSVPRKKDIDELADAVDKKYSPDNPPPYPVTTVDGATGNVTTNAVKYTTQSLNDSQKTQARKNIGAVTSNDVTAYEAKLRWGGENKINSFSPIDASMMPQLSANRLAFMPIDGITIEYSLDGGSTWNNYDATEEKRYNLFCGIAGYDGFYIGGTSATGIDKSQYMLRITFDSKVCRVYTKLNKFGLYISTNGSSGCYCTIMGRTHANYTSDNDVWSTFANHVNILGWSGLNIINTQDIITYSNTDTQFQQIRFIFGVSSHPSSVKYGGLRILNIYGYGGVGWNYPSNLSGIGTIYTYDAWQNCNFPNGVTAKAFNGDTSDTVVAFTQSATRANIATGNNLSTLFGKISKWLADLGSLAFKSTVAKTDLSTDVQTSLSKADTALQSAPVTSVNSKTGAVVLSKSDIGLGNVDNVKQYSVSNPPPYPVTSVNGQTGAVVVDVELPTNLVKYDAISDIESVDSLNADTLQGHPASYFATNSDITTAANKIAENASAISELTTEQSNLSSSVDNLSTSKLNKTGDTMTGALVAQSNTNYTTAQVRNIIMSTSDPTGGSNGDIWIKYQA